jgi:hypothetical protein
MYRQKRKGIKYIVTRRRVRSATLGAELGRKRDHNRPPKPLGPFDPLSVIGVQTPFTLACVSSFGQLFRQRTWGGL